MLIVNIDTPESDVFAAASKQVQHTSRDILSTTTWERMPASDAMTARELKEHFFLSKKQPQNEIEIQTLQ